MTGANAYDRIAYPALLFRQMHPDALAVIARLHGIPAAPAATARVLDVGGGDGLHDTAIAAAYPGAQVVNFDLAREPIARGRRWAEAAGIANVRHAVADILTAADRLEGPFDYITAHGIFSWTPPEVQAALWPLIAHLLAPNGVAFVSYNALPGGHSRMALRQMILHHLRDVAGPAERLARTRTFLSPFAEPQTRDEPITAAMRREAEAALAQPDGLLFHDLLNEFYATHSLLDATSAAAAQGLRYLGDVARGGLEKGFVDPDKAGLGYAAYLNALQARDYARGRYFRSSLFVRAEAPLSRGLVPEAARAMWVSSDVIGLGDGRFRLGRDEFAPEQPQLRASLEALAAARPGWPRVEALVADDAALVRLCDFALSGLVDLHPSPPPFTITPGERPRASALARLQAATGEPRLATLDHRLIPPDAGLRALLPRLDGTRTQFDLNQPALLDAAMRQALLVA